MLKRVSINIGYSYTHYSIGETGFESVLTLKETVDLLQNCQCDITFVKSWLETLITESQGEDLVLIIPNRAYSDKVICKKLEDTVSVKNFKIISECEAIASFMISNNEIDSDYKVVDFGQTTIHVHNFKLVDKKFMHIKSIEIQIDNKESVANILNKKADPIFSSVSDDEFYSFLNREHQNLIEMPEELLDCPIKTDSEINYVDLKYKFQNLSIDCYEKLKNIGFIDNNDTIYCGGQSGLQTFMYYVTNGAKSINDVRYSKVKGGMKWNNEMYPRTTEIISVKMFCPKENDFLLLSANSKTNTGDIHFLGGQNKVQVSILCSKERFKPISLKYGKKILEFSVDKSFVDALAIAPLKENKKYKSQNVELGVTIDGCQNLSVHFTKNSKTIYSDIIDKI